MDHEKLVLTKELDKIFLKSEKVNYRKVTFQYFFDLPLLRISSKMKTVRLTRIKF